MSIMVKIDPAWQTANIFVLFNAFETMCFPQCITDLPRVYFLPVKVRKSGKYINFCIYPRGSHGLMDRALDL